MKITNDFKITLAQVISGTDAIVAAAKNVKAEGKKLDQQIQVVLASGALHAHIHGDWTIANTVIENLSRGIRTNAAKGYVEAFYPVRFNKKTKAFVYSKEKRLSDVTENKERKEFLDALLTTDWLCFKPETDFVPVDAVSACESLVKRLAKAMEDDRNMVSAAEIEVLKAAMGQIATLRANSTQQVLEAVEELNNAE